MNPIGGIGPSMAIDGTLVVDEVFMQSAAGGIVTVGSLNQQPPTTAVNLVQGTTPILADPGPDWTEARFDRFAVPVPFSTAFNHAGGNLHVWIRFSRLSTAGEFQVDCTADTDQFPFCGTQFSSQLAGSVVAIGSVPVLGLLPSPTPLVQVLAQLVVHGEPRTGQAMELQVSRLPFGAPVLLAFGTFQLGAGAPCAQHVANPTTTPLALADPVGFYRFTSNLLVPVNAAFVHSEFGVQAVFLDGASVLLSNALRVRIGGSR